MKNAAKIETKNKNIWLFVTIFILFISISRTIRFPNIWSYSHFLFNYENGFTKRALLGAFFNCFGIPFFRTYAFFFVFSYAIYIFNIYLLISLLRKIIRSNQAMHIFASIVFVSSLGIVFLTHTIGYFDHIGLLITLICLHIEGFNKRIIFLFIAMPIALLIHEAILIMFFPVMFMSLILSMNNKKQAIALAVFTLMTMIIAFVVSNATLDPDTAERMYQMYDSENIHTLRRGAFNVLKRNVGSNVDIIRTVWTNPVIFAKLILSLAVTAPSFVFIIYVLMQILHQNKKGKFTILLSILAALSPIVLHCFGWDTYRWNTMVIITTFLMFYLVFSSCKDNTIKKSPSKILPIFIIIVFINGASNLTLFDEYKMRNLPFLGEMDYFHKIKAGDRPFFKVPRY